MNNPEITLVLTPYPTLAPRPQQPAKNPPAVDFAQFLHKIPAGFPSPAADYLDEGLDLNAYLVQHPASTYFFTVSGSSMADAGILPGDKVAVDRAIEPQHGHIVVAIIDAEYTLKRLYQLGGVVELRAANPKYQPIRFREGDELQIWGVVVGLVRRYRP